MDLKKEINKINNERLPNTNRTERLINLFSEYHQALQLRENAVISRLSMQEVLNYEIHSHWLAGWISFEWGQEIMGRYFAWKVKRKYNRYLYSLECRKRVLNGL